MKRWWLVCLMMGACTVQAQEEDDVCAFPTDKKIIKLLQQSEDSKYTRKEQFQFLNDALKRKEDCIECKYAYAIKSYAYQQTLPNPNFDKTITYFSEIIRTCPQYHSDCYYFMGTLAYERKDNDEALTYFRQFLEFKSKDGKAYANDYAKKKADAQEIVTDLEFNAEFFKNPVPFNPKRVGNVSTEAGEYLPMMSPDNQILFFTRQVDRAAMGDIKSKVVEEFSMAYRNELTDPFDAGTALPKPFNVGPNYGGSTISIDNKELIICSCYEVLHQGTPKEYKNCDLFSVHYEKYIDEHSGRQKYRWTEMQNLGPYINAKDSWEAQPSLSSDGNTLFFVKLSDDTQLSDIFYSERDAKGNWGPARPLKELNSAGNDKTPFLHSDSKTLYFSSDESPGRKGAGGYDIMYSRMDAAGKWTKPKNLGHPINTEGDEVGLIVSSDGKLAYFASKTIPSARGWDIFSFELYQEARPEKITIVKGDLIDAMGNPVYNARVELKYAKTGEVSQAKVDTVDGKFVAAVKSTQNDEVLVTVKKEGHSFSSKLVVVDENSKPLIKDLKLDVQPIEKGKSYTINDILFATASFELNQNSKFVIDQFIDFLKENIKVKIEIQGHTDNEGDPAKNLALSESRAKAVMEYILSKGVDANRLSYKGYGQTKPKSPNTTPENKARNRRTEFFIIET